MGHLKSVHLLSQKKDVNDQIHLAIHEELRRGLEEHNAFEYWEDVTVTTPASANTEFEVRCVNLNRTPVYYLIIKKDKAVDVYSSSTVPINNRLFLKATVASATITVRVFV